MNNYSINASISNIIKNIIWKISLYEIKKPPIFIFAHRRGGSTLLMEAFASGNNYRFTDQPLSITSNSFNYLHKLPHPEYYKHISFFNENDEKLFKRYINDILEGKTIVSSQWNILKDSFHLRYDSTVFKLLNANALIDWFINEFPNAEFVYLIRNPINQADSCMRNGWLLEYDGYLRNDKYRKKYLSDEKIKKINQYHSDKGSLEQYVINWILDALPILKSENKSKISIYRFEDLIAKDEIKVQLAKRMDLNINNFLKTFNSPSKSTKKYSKKETYNKIKNNAYDPYAVKKPISKKEKSNVIELLNLFEIDVYKI